MFISNKFSSAISLSVCSVALLGAVGCSNDGLHEPKTAAQPQSQSAATQPQSGSQGATTGQSARAVSGTTRGRVSRVNADGSLVVLGQTIYVSTATVYVGVTGTGITVGDYVTVDGSVDGSGRIVAGAIELDTSFDPVVNLMGVVTNVDFDSSTFQVGGITVGFDAVNFSNFDSAGLSNGMVVEIAADEQNFDSTFTQVAVDSISVLGNGSVVSVGPNGVLVSDDNGTVMVNDNGDTAIVGANGESVVVDDNSVSINANGTTMTGNSGISVNNGSVVIDENGVSVNAVGAHAQSSVVIGSSNDNSGVNADTVTVDQNGVTINDSEGTTSVTTDGITIDGVDLQDMINDTIDDTLNDILDLGDLNAYDYSQIKLSASSNCLSVGAPAQFQVTGDTIDSMNGPVTHNLSGQVSVHADLPGRLDVVANDGAGLYLNMNDQDIVEMQIVAGDTTLTHYIGALPDTVERPVVLAKQTANWCSFIIFEHDNCTSITNQTSSVVVNAGPAVVDTSNVGTTVTAGQTVVDTSAAGTTITIDGEPLIDIESNQWLSENGMAESVSSHSGVSVSGCTLSNPENIPVITVE